jgi:hypothetical protein
MQVKIKQRKGADECHFAPKYVAIGCESVRYVSARCELDGSHGRAHGGLHQRGMHPSERKDCAEPGCGKRVVRKVCFIN